MGNILLNYNVVYFNILLSVARQVVHDFESGKEWRHKDEKDVGQQGWSPLLIYKMSDELCHPAEKMNKHHNFLVVAAKGLLLKIHMQEGLHNNDAKHSHSWTHSSNKKVTHKPDYG